MTEVALRQHNIDPEFPDLVGAAGGPLIPCKVVECTVTMAPTERVEGRDGMNATYEQAQRYVIRYQPKPGETDVISESGLNNIGHKQVRVAFGCHGDAKIVTCCGCGFPVNQNHPRSLIRNPDAYMGTYGPCCAPTGKKLGKARKRAAKRLARYHGDRDDSEFDDA